MSGALQDWKSQKKPFAAVATAPVFWLGLFFIAPMTIVWLYSFGQNAGPADIDISGTLDNYKRATEWLYLSIFLKSFAVRRIQNFFPLHRWNWIHWDCTWISASATHPISN